ncbi:60S acidic ribosomal protein P2 [Tritrichomonas musculus]|uniref:60S acidic ribosomal protein P2 n=1 Tax=Tritrichomonas musculus TaxID=1915356 RepID=A0ABR2JPK3_9EUKA
MKYIAAYLLAQLGGNTNPNKEDIERILESVGIEVDKAKAEEIIEKLKGKDVSELIENGKAKLSIVSGGQVQISNEQQTQENKEESKDQKKEEEEEPGLALDWNIFEE